MIGFFEGGWYYNLWSIVVSVLGLLLTGGGFFLAFRQISKTRTAAEAASAASAQTAQQVQNITAILDLTQLCSHCKQIVDLLRNRDVRGACVRIEDLRCGLARTREMPGAAMLLTKRRWTTMISRVAAVEDCLTQYANAKPSDVRDCANAIAAVGDALNSLTAKTAWRNGDHANS